MEFFSFDALRALSKHVHSFAARTELLEPNLGIILLRQYYFG